MNQSQAGEDLAPQERSEDRLAQVVDDLQGSAAGEPQERSLREDFEALIEDGKTYLETELVYQKTRAAYVADKAKGAVVFGAIAAVLGVLALIGLTVGLIIALAPFLTAWGASAVVVGMLMIGALLAARSAGRRWNKLMAAIEGGERQ